MTGVFIAAILLVACCTVPVARSLWSPDSSTSTPVVTTARNQTVINSGELVVTHSDSGSVTVTATDDGIVVVYKRSRS